jgi:predicted GTPase
MLHAHYISQTPSPRNVVFIGETGSGKSSVINLIAGRDHTVVSPDATPCTSNFASYDVSIKGNPYRLWDTPGLNEASGFFKSFRRKTLVTGSLKGFLQEKRRRGELDLLVFCVRGGRAHTAMSRAYTIFCRATRRIAIPVVIAITHLERVQPTMEAWWQNNERELGDLGLLFDGHACLTCLSPHHRRRASQQDICALISTEFPQLRQARSTLSDREYLVDPNNGCVVS